MTHLKIKHLTKSFGGVHAVNQANLTFEGGKITALIGPNGSGKTTLVNTITGLLPMDEGSIVVGNNVVRKGIQPSEIVAYGITRTFQNVRLINQMSVLDNILFVLTERSVWNALLERHTTLHLNTAKELLHKVNLWGKRHEPAENLSYGQRKLLEIARAIAMRAQVYFFDEPFAGLFTEMSKIVSGILDDLRKGGAAIVLIEHDMALVRELSDYCYVLDSGKVIAEGNPDEVLRQPHVIEAYLSK